MKLSDWARQQGVTYKTAWKWFKQGKLPVPAEQLPTGTILVYPEKQTSGKVAIYARVSSSDQRSDLDRQVARLVEWSTAQGLTVSMVVKEIGSGLNGNRKGLMKLLSNPEVDTIVVEHRDRLARFGVEFVQAALQAHGRRLLVVEEREIDDDIVRDLREVVFSLCARLYGKRSARLRAERAVKAATADADSAGT